MQKSSFYIKIEKDNNKIDDNDNIYNKLIYDKITINDKEEINIDFVKQLKAENDILNKNYRKFLSILNQIENKFKNEIPYNIDIELKFENTNENLKINFAFYINCTYLIKLPNNSNIFSFKDENILINELNNGINYTLNEINSIIDEKENKK